MGGVFVCYVVHVCKMICLLIAFCVRQLLCPDYFPVLYSYYPQFIFMCGGTRGTQWDTSKLV